MSDNGDPWRYRCPNKHTDWQRSGNGYWCRKCKKNGDDYRFDELVDMKEKPLRY